MKLFPVTFPLGQRVSTVFVFTSGGKAGVFDAGCRGDATQFIIPALVDAGYTPDDLQWVIGSHPDVDHFGGIADFLDWSPTVTTVAHRDDQPLMESTEVFLLERGNELAALGCPEEEEALEWLHNHGGGITITSPVSGDTEIAVGEDTLTIIHLPGHSKGHLALWWESERLLTISDAILGDSVPFANGEPSFPPTYRFVDDYLASINRVRHMPVDVLHTAHYGSFEGSDVTSFLDVSERFALTLEEVVHDVVATAPLRITDIIVGVDARIGVWPKPTSLTALGQPVLGHLERLENSGQIIRRGVGPDTTWQDAS